MDRERALEDENRKLRELLNLASNHVPLSQLTLRGNIDAALAAEPASGETRQRDRARIHEERFQKMGQPAAPPPPPTQGEPNEGYLTYTAIPLADALRQRADEAYEECAKIVEDYSKSYGGEWPALDRIKAAIRARIARPPGEIEINWLPIVRERDRFIVDKGLWQEFVESLEDKP